MLREFERKLWEVDQRINQRGFKVDLTLAKKAMIMCAKEKLELDRKVSSMTRGSITSATQVKRIGDFLRKTGVDLPDLKAATLDMALSGDELKGDARVLLEARRRVSKSSTSKFETLLSATGPDGRLRGGVQFAGASRTGRWAGRLFQPHNLPRSPLKPDEIETAIRAIKTNNADLLTDNVHELCSHVARSVVVSEKGKELLVCDYSAIEGRVLAWLCNERWKLQAYGAGRDMYVVTFRRTFGHDDQYTLKGNDRQIGKVLELAFQYGGGVGAILSACDTYRVDPVLVAKAAWSVASKTTQRQCRKNHEYAIKRNDALVHHLSEKLWCMLESAKIMWRDSSPQTTSLWKNYEEAAKAAVRKPGKAFKAGRCVFQVRAGMLAARLPSGRVLIYLKPSLRKKEGSRPELRYVSPYGLPEKLYGGKLAENITQAAARDILGYAMVNVDEKGFDIVLHVHDEIVAEQDIGEPELTYDLLKEIMCRKPAWAGGLPLTAEGFVATRYRKD